MSGRNPARPVPNRAEPCRAKPDSAEPDSAEPDSAGPDGAAPDGAAPDGAAMPDWQLPLGSAAPFIPFELPVPAIPASAGAMIFDRSGRLLILKPTYKSGWTIPGGVMEADGETPWDACRREVREECGLDVQSGRLACVDFRRPRPARPAGSGQPGKPASPGGIRFLFDCGQLPGASFAAVVLQPAEISEYRLARPAAALKLLRKPIRRRVAAALRGGPPRYLENGRPVPGIGR